MKRSIHVSEICRRFDLHYYGPDIKIDGLNLCNRNSKFKRILTYVEDGNYVDAVRSNRAVAGIVVRERDMVHYQELMNERQLVLVVSDEPEKNFYDIHDYLYYETDFYDKFQFEAIIGSNCKIHSSVVIEKGVVIGNDVNIGANSVIRKGTVVKDGCIIGCNSTIGSEGFQILRVGRKNRKIVHCGGVLIEENACICDNVAVCNSLFEGCSYVGKNAMIDNLVHVGHNGYVGDNAVVTAGTILCGSAIVENGAWIGVNSSVLNRITVGSYSKIGIGSVVTRDVPKESLAYGVPAKTKVFFEGM